jgi:hypothetical protein
MFRFLRYVINHPREAARTFWSAYTGTENPNERIAEEESRLNALRLALGIYNHDFGRLPAKLEDLCFNNHNDSTWESPFIHWRGSDTFHDTFGFPYQYCVADGTFTLFSPGLETAKKYRGTPTANGRA